MKHHLDLDTYRCSAWGCPQKESCMRFVDRFHLGPRTGVVGFMFEDNPVVCNYKLIRRNTMSNNAAGSTMKVRVTKANDDNWYTVGEEHIVLVEPRGDIDGSYHPIVEGGRAMRYGIGVSDFKVFCEIEKPNKKPHKHAEVIKAWADGDTVQIYISGAWRDVACPVWDGDTYRIKPEPESPKTTLTAANLYRSFLNGSDDSEKACLRIVNEALQHFITSGQMDAYIKERDNADN